MLNASNIQVGGTSTGVPATEAVTVAAPAAPAGATTNAASSPDDLAKRMESDTAARDRLANAFKPTIVTVDVTDEGDTLEDRKKKKPN